MTSLDPDPMRERSEPALSTHRCLRGGIAQNKKQEREKTNAPAWAMVAGGGFEPPTPRV